MIFQHLTVLGLIGAAVSAGLLVRFGPIIDSTAMPGTCRTAVVLSGPLAVYTLALLNVFVRKSELVQQRARAYWVERLNACLEDRAADPSFKDILDLAAWLHAGFWRSTYAIRSWEIEGDR